MKTPKKPGKASSKKSIANKPKAKPSTKEVMEDDEDFSVPLDEFDELDNFNDFDDDDDY